VARRRISEPLTIDQIAAACHSKIRTGVGYLGDEVSQARAQLWDRYFGRPYGNEEPDQSDFVATEIAEVIDWMMPELMAIFLSTPEVVKFNPKGEGDETASKHETAVVNNLLFKGSDTYGLIHAWLMDGLVCRNGVVKAWWEERRDVRTESYDDLLPEEVDQLIAGMEMEGAEVDVLKRQENVETVIDEVSGEPVGEEVTVSLDLKIVETIKRARAVCLPPDEFVIEPRHNSLKFDYCPFAAHRQPDVARGDLIAMGYDPDDVNSLRTHDDLVHSAERTSRFDAEGSRELREYNDAPGMERCTISECYIRLDVDGDGDVEVLKVTVGGADGPVLRWAPHMKRQVNSFMWPYDVEVVARMPFHAWSPYMLPHKFHGQSVADKVEDIQVATTQITRQALDNMAFCNNPRPVINTLMATADTVGDTLDTRPGSGVRVKGAAGEAISWMQVDSQIQPDLMMLEHFKVKKSERTGVTEWNQGIDPDSFHKLSGVAIENTQQAGRGKLMMHARNFAESVKSVATHFHELVRLNADRDMKVLIGEKWIPVEPRRWLRRSEMTAKVGLGTGSDEAKQVNVTQLLELQNRLAVLGGSTYRHVYNTLAILVDVMKIGEISQFFVDPDEFEAAGGTLMPQPQGDGGQAEALLEAEKGKAQAGILQTQTKAGVDMRKMLAEDDRKRDELRVKLAAELVKLGVKPEQAVEAIKTIEAGLKAQPPQIVAAA
jgi:hypothetical protein